MKTHRLHINADISQLPLLHGFCQEHAIDNQTMLALEEAMVNIANYSGASYIDLIFQDKESVQIFIFEDDGCMFDPCAYTPSDENAAELIAGGQGIRIIRKMMDALHYQRTDNKNIFSLVKNKR